MTLEAPFKPDMNSENFYKGAIENSNEILFKGENAEEMQATYHTL